MIIANNTEIHLKAAERRVFIFFGCAVSSLWWMGLKSSHHRNAVVTT